MVDGQSVSCWLLLDLITNAWGGGTPACSLTRLLNVDAKASRYYSFLKTKKVAELIPVICLLAASIAFQNLGSSVPAPTAGKFQGPSGLAADERLQQKITVSATGISLEELLKGIGVRGVTLISDKDCGDQKLQLRLRKRPLYVLMRSLAELLPGNWVSLDNKSGYLLIMSPKAVHARQNWWALWEQERQRALTEVVGALVHEMQRPPDPPSLGDITNPPIIDPKVAKRLFNVLSPSMQEEIASHIDDDGLYGARDGKGAYDEQEALVYQVGDLPPAAREVLVQQNHAITGHSLITFMNSGTSVQANVIGPDGGFQVSTMSIRVNSPLVLSLSMNDEIMLDAVKKGYIENVPDTWKRLIAYQETRFWKNDVPVSAQYHSTPPLRSELLQWIAARANIDFVSDYYSRPGTTFVSLTGDPLTTPQLEAELNRDAVEQDMSWKQYGQQLYLFRNNRWYRDDLREVPYHLAQKYLATVPQKASGPLVAGGRFGTPLNSGGQLRLPSVSASGNGLARIQPGTSTHSEVASLGMMQALLFDSEIVKDLSRWQISNGLRWLASDTRPLSLAETVEEASPPTDPLELFPLTRYAIDATHCRAILTFYSQLSVSQQFDICAGTLPLSDLSPDLQQRAFALSPMMRAVAVNNQGTKFLLGLGNNMANRLSLGYSVVR